MATKTKRPRRQSGHVDATAAKGNGIPIPVLPVTPTQAVIIQEDGGLNHPQVTLVRTWMDRVKWMALGQDYVLAFRTWPFDNDMAYGKISITNPRKPNSPPVTLTLLYVKKEEWTPVMQLKVKGKSVSKYSCLPADLLEGLFDWAEVHIFQTGPEVLGEEPPIEPLTRVKARRR